MKADFAILLSGLGYYKLSKQRRKTLLIIVGTSVGIHLLAMIAFGSMTLIRSLREEKVVFKVPPPLKTYEPRKLEHEVKIQKRQRSSSRPSMRPRIVAMKPMDFALPEIKTDAKAIKTSFQPKFRAVSGVGLGTGLGTGYGVGGFGMGVSEFDFFGIRGRGDKIAILVDVSESMVEDEKGGEKGYIRVKNKICDVVDALSEQGMFSLIVFADAASALEPKMIIANSENKEKAKKFLFPFNTAGSYGLCSGNLHPSDLGLRAIGGTTRLDLALTAAFEQGADTILIISDGLPMVKKEIAAVELEAYKKQVEQWEKKNQKLIEAYNEARANTPYEEKKVWVAPRQRREGQAEIKGHWTTQKVYKQPLPNVPSKPSSPNAIWTLSDFVDHFETLHKALYVQKGGKPPVLHAIGYSIDDKGSNFLKALIKHYKGRYRRVGERVK